jgi:hypothetical protein
MVFHVLMCESSWISPPQMAVWLVFNHFWNYLLQT